MISRFCLTLGFLLAPLAMAADTFPFSLTPGPDGSPCRGEIDLTYLNEAPAGKQGFVKVRGEQFVDGAGKELRFFGTNVTATALFPPKADAPRFAAHLASVGHNIVRCHFLDNQWGGEALLKKPNFAEWDLEALDKFHYFAAELKKRGVYLNINLHVGRKYEGTPEGAPDFSKGLDLFYTPFVEAFQQYSKTLLTTKNPYTGLSLTDDPAVAVVELNNENTLLMNPWWLADLKDPIRSELLALWNGWLAKKYASDAVMEAAYGRSTGLLGPEQVKPVCEDSWSTPWRRDDLDAQKSTVKALPEGTGVRWEVKQAGAAEWTHQFSHGFTEMKTGERFKLRFKARADRARAMGVLFMLNEAPYSNAGLQESANLTTDWKDYEMELAAGEVTGKKARLTFSAKNQLGWIDLKDVSMQAISAGFLQPGNLLSAKTVPLPKRNAEAVVRHDFFAFLAETEIKWAKDQIAFLKKEVGLKVPVAHSQVLFGGMMGARREHLVSDFVDTHGYWQHPHFTGKGWDMKNWEIENTSQLLSQDGGTLREMAMQRPIGKPYTVSEYDIPAPHDHAAEMYPMLACMASQQGWAGIYSYCWANGLPAMQGGKIHGFFDQCGHPAKEGFMPAAALCYRQGLIKPHVKTATLTLGDAPLFDDLVRSNGDVWSSWRRVWKPDRQPFLADEYRFGLNFSPKPSTSTLNIDLDVFGVTLGRNREAASPLFSFYDERVAMVTGKLTEKAVSVGWIRLSFGKLPDSGHATAMLVSLDGKSVASSKKVLFTVMCRAENEGMGWANNRKTVSDRWGNGPAQVFGAHGTLNLHSNGYLHYVTPLDSTGKRMKKRLMDLDCKFTFSPEDQTMWYLLEE